MDTWEYGYKLHPMVAIVAIVAIVAMVLVAIVAIVAIVAGSPDLSSGAPEFGSPDLSSGGCRFLRHRGGGGGRGGGAAWREEEGWQPRPERWICEEDEEDEQPHFYCTASTKADHEANGAIS